MKAQRRYLRKLQHTISEILVIEIDIQTKSRLDYQMTWPEYLSVYVLIRPENYWSQYVKNTEQKKSIEMLRVNH